MIAISRRRKMATRVLVTGGAGVLGSQVVTKLNARGYAVRVMSRRQRPAGLPMGVEWAHAEMTTGEGLPQALDQVHTIVHAASSPLKQTYRVDVEGTRRLLQHAQTTGVAHLVYISIVGIDRIPSYAYYRIKLATEDVIANGGVPWTILRATQFHELLDYVLSLLTRFPVAPVPTDLPFQPVDSGEVADALCECVAHGAAGRLPDLGGPEVLRGREIAETWLQARGRRRFIVPLYLPGKTAQGFRRGFHTCPDRRQGKITWGEWGVRKYSNPTLAASRSPYSGRILA
jgi:uncharacterized protein YbjT (DUF2867 family)